MRMGVSFPFLPQRLIVSGVTLRKSAASLTVSKSGSSSPIAILNKILQMIFFIRKIVGLKLVCCAKSACKLIRVF